MELKKKIFSSNMKYKNYKSAIYNFTHSFISIDFMKSGRLAVNVLIELYKLGIENKATFDFIEKTIKPKEAESKEALQLLNDYFDWLPEHFVNHKCDLTELKKLEITFFTEFEKAITPPRMNDIKELKINALTIWNAEGKNEQIIEISKTELIKSNYLKIGIPEL